MSEPHPLDLFREGDEAAQDHDGVMLVGDAQAMRLCVAWSRTAPQWVQPDGPVPETPNARWSWAWGAVRPEYSALATMARIPMSSVMEVFGTLKVARLILPDGSLATVARELIAAHVEEMKRPDRRRRKGAKA